NAGNVVTRSSTTGSSSAPQANTITYTYDELNRATSVTYSGGDAPAPALVYGYDTAPLGIGRLASKSNGVGRTDVTGYDEQGRPRTLRQEVLGVGATLSYDYDALGNLTGM